MPKTRENPWNVAAIIPSELSVLHVTENTGISTTVKPVPVTFCYLEVDIQTSRLRTAVLIQHLLRIPASSGLFKNTITIFLVVIGNIVRDIEPLQSPREALVTENIQCLPTCYSTILYYSMFLHPLSFKGVILHKSPLPFHLCLSLSNFIFHKSQSRCTGTLTLILVQ